MKAELKDKHTLTTDLILVVKGAGEQKADATLYSFLDGFLKAARGYDTDAIVNIGPETKILKDYNYTSSFRDEKDEQNIVEVILEDMEPNEDDAKASTTKLRRIWIKEAYWEPRLGSPGAFRSLLHEWRLTSYALIKLIEKTLYPWQDNWVQQAEKNYQRKYHPKNTRKHFAWAYFLYYFLAYAVVLLFLNLTGVWGSPLTSSALNIFRSTGSFHPLLFTPWNHILIILGIAVLAAMTNARRARRAREIETETGKLPRMPGLSNWLLFGLMAALLLQPLAYIGWLAVYAIIFVISNLIARRIAWNQRADFYTDAPMDHEIDEAEKLLYRRQNRIALTSQLFYRVLVTIALPIVVTLLSLSNIFRILNIFGDLGTRIHTTLSNIIVQTFGDVTAYAVDPTAASKVQNVVEEEIHTFTHLTRRQGINAADPQEQVINNIHLFAHSQGTPITFEVLFHKLPQNLLKRVNTFITIGSVLNLHHLVNEVLDDNFWSRFPPVEYPKLNLRFKWFNFWNFTDPITQFTGLEAYRQDTLWITEEGDIHRYYDGTARPKNNRASPFSIKTRDSLLKNHSEYWGNHEEIHAPFIERIFYKRGTSWIPDAWASEEIKFKHAHRKLGGWNLNLMNVDGLDGEKETPEQKSYRQQRLRHFRWFVLSWLLLASVAGFLFSLTGKEIAAWIDGRRQSTLTMLSDLILWIGSLLPDGLTTSFSGLWAAISDIYMDQQFINMLGLGLLIWAMSSIIFQTIPTLKVVKGLRGRLAPKPIIFFDPEKAKAKLKARRRKS